MGERVAVVGAGYAGMAAAVTLARRGIPVTVFESGPVPGGRARRVSSQGVELDNGQHILVGAYTTLFDLMSTVGVPPDALLRVPLEIRYPGKFSFRALWLPPPLDLAGGFLLMRGVPWSERLAALRFIGKLRKARFRLETDLPVEDLLKAHAQDGAIGHFLWRPLCVSALNTPANVASSRVFLAVLRDALFGEPGGSDLLLPRVDLSRLFPEAAAAFVAKHGGEVRYGTTLRSLKELEDFASVIVAVGPHQLKVLLPELGDPFEYQPIYTCYLQYREGVKLPFPMLGLADGLVQWVFDRGALLGERGRLACVISAQGDHQQMEQDELAEVCARELSSAGLVKERPEWMRVIAEKRATIASLAGMNKTVREKIPSGIVLAGDYTDPEYPPTLEAAVRSGVRAAMTVSAAAPRARAPQAPPAHAQPTAG
jgi:squalene-associated FAD-dependent desaturase